MTWLDDMRLRDIDDSAVLEATCRRCLHTWLQSPLQLLLKVDHRNVTLAEVARDLACVRPGCRHAGVRLALLRRDETSAFVGGMP
jgi:hypothetical protein